MAKTKKPKRSKPEKVVIQAAIQLAQESAKATLKQRKKALDGRAKTVRKNQGSAARARAATPLLAARFREAAGPTAADRWLVAEGDSWFDYPRRDVLKILQDKYGYEVERVSHKGDRVEEMAYGEGQLEEFCRAVEKLIRNGHVPRAILLSGGGNDITGEALAMLLNHARSPISGLSESVMRGVVDERMFLSYVTIITKVTSVCEAKLGRKLPLLVHGYGYPVPDGRGFAGGWWLLPGPWLKPGFDQKGFADLAANTKTMRVLIDRFNTMLASLSQLNGLEHVRYVDLRKCLTAGNGEKSDWANELHPNEEGFKKVVAEFEQVLSRL
ncbi:MAG: hypothetical protein IPK72_08925 [Candidatus Eisenbacteria bacterium]|nr:hypothetical protein [Candidatus Eisenbacteria bacterium]